jgi:hypothetical protein
MKLFFTNLHFISKHVINEYRHPSLSAVNWFQKNRALSELRTKASVQKLESTALYCASIMVGNNSTEKQCQVKHTIAGGCLHLISWCSCPKLKMCYTRISTVLRITCLLQEVLGRTNLPTFPMAMVAIVTFANDCKWSNHNHPTIKQSQTTAVQSSKSCLQLTTLNLNHFRTVEDIGLKIIALRSPWMYQISWKTTKRFKSY